MDKQKRRPAIRTEERGRERGHGQLGTSEDIACWETTRLCKWVLSQERRSAHPVCLPPLHLLLLLLRLLLLLPAPAAVVKCMPSAPAVPQNSLTALLPFSSCAQLAASCFCVAFNTPQPHPVSPQFTPFPAKVFSFLLSQKKQNTLSQSRSEVKVNPLKHRVLLLLLLLETFQ